MDRRGFVTSGMAAGMAGIAGAGGSLPALLDRVPGWAAGKTMADGDIRLSSNENPLGVSPAAREAIIEAIVESNRYGGRRQEVLEALARYLGVGTENLTLGFGSTEILQICTQAFQGPNTPLIAAAPTFEDVMDYQDTMPFEVMPWDPAAPGAILPIHCLDLVEMGLTQGQNWDLEELAADCEADGQYDFLLEASPQPFVGGIGSPVNPVAIK